MRYVSIDIETTGLNPETDQILEFGAVIDDTLRPDVPVEELPTFRKVIRSDRLSGTPMAIAINASLINFIASVEKPEENELFCLPKDLGFEFFVWLRGHGFKIKNNSNAAFVPAGKNYAGFDSRFLNKIPHWNTYLTPCHRTLDPAILYFDPLKDEKPPSLYECLERAGFDATVKHTAVDDARDVVRLLRHKFAEVSGG